MIENANYELKKASREDYFQLCEYKKKSIFENAGEMDCTEKEKICKFVEKAVSENIEEFQNILVDGKVVGCVRHKYVNSRIFLDDIYIEEAYRGRGLGRSIIRGIMREGIVYLWVYKSNEKAVSLYKKLGFEVEEEDEDRWKMITLGEDVLDYFDIEYTKGRLIEWSSQGVEPEFCFEIDGEEYMIIPFKDSLSIQWLGHMEEIYFDDVETLFDSRVFDRIKLNENWKNVNRIWFY